MVMKTYFFAVCTPASTVVLMMAGNSGCATEPTSIHSLHRVLVVNNTEQSAAVRKEYNLIAALQTRQHNGQWRVVSKFRAPIGVSAAPMPLEGEVWQFFAPWSRTFVPAKVRLAVGTTGTVYSRPFEGNVDQLAANKTKACCLARHRYLLSQSSDRGVPAA
jgi:hypothetical protein